MKTLANYLKIIPLSDYNSFDGERLITNSGNEPDHIPTNNDLVLTDTPDAGSAGTIYKQSLRAVTDKLTDAQRAVYVTRRPVMVLLFTDDGTPVLWGSADYPVRITITPTPDVDILDFKRTALKSVF
jgi:hypothetical protein